MRPFSFLLLLSWVLGCGTPPAVDPLPFPAAAPGTAPLPSTWGPFPVGVRTVTYEDTTRKDAHGVPRQLVTEIWYPALQSARGQPGVAYDLKPYFTDAQQVALAKAGLPLIPTVAVRDATPTHAHGQFPLVIFAHGQGGVRMQSVFYTVLLASHGYVVVAPDHPGGTLYDIARNQLENTGHGLENRPTDVIYLINKLARLKSDDPLYGLLDLDRVGVTGHSFGALTSLRVAALDARVKAIVPQAPTSTDIAWLGLTGVKLTIPVEIQGAHRDQTLPWDEHVAPAWAAMQRPRWLVDLKDGGHFTFSDLCALDLAGLADALTLDIPGADIKKVLSDGCAAPAPSAALSQPLMNHFAVGYFNAVLRGSQASYDLLDQAHADALAPGIATITSEP